MDCRAGRSSGRRRPSAGGSQRLCAPAAGAHGPRAGGRASTADRGPSSIPAAGKIRPQDSAPVSAANPEPGRSNSVDVSVRDQHQRHDRITGSPAGAGGERRIADHGEPAGGNLEAGIRRLESTFAGGSTVRVPVGGRGVFQYSHGRRQSLHSGAAGGHRRWAEGNHRHCRWLPGK